MYPEHLTAPMAKELTDHGFKNLVNAQEVQEIMDSKTGTVLVLVNSVCGCAAGGARPGVKMALNSSAKKPDHLVTVSQALTKKLLKLQDNICCLILHLPLL
jgi:putative YphP/YqiW family bacilliredoxin